MWGMIGFIIGFVLGVITAGKAFISDVKTLTYEQLRKKYK